MLALSAPLIYRADSETAANSIESINVAAQQSANIIVRISLKQPLVNSPARFRINSPPSIAFRFPNTGNALGQKLQEISEGELLNLNIVQASERTWLIACPEIAGVGGTRTWIVKRYASRPGKVRPAIAALFFSLVVMLCAASDANAQFPGGGFPGGGFPGGGFPGGGFPGGTPGGGGPRDSARGGDRPDGAPPGERAFPMREDLTDRLEVPLEELHKTLDLSPAQEAPWRKYAERIMRMADDLSRERVDTQTPAPATALDKIRRAVDSNRNRLAALEEIELAARGLYSQLSTEQKIIADNRLDSLIPTNSTLMLPDISRKPPARGGRFGSPDRRQ